MFIDLVFFILMIMAVAKGISKGLIVAVFSFFAFIVGLAAALKLSSTVAAHLRGTIVGGVGFLLPFISFLLVFAGVALAIRWGAALVKKAASVAMLGWVDTLGGILLYAVIYTMIYSIILFFATKMHLLSAAAQQASNTYGFIEPFGPKVMMILGAIIPFFSHMFADLTSFFAGVSHTVH